MDQPRPFFVRYPVFASTIVLAIIGGVLALTGLEEAARWIISIFALAIAAKESVGMVRSILKGSWGIDVLAVTAIIATVLVGEYWASIIIVLMFTGGEALEDYAESRAKRELTSLLDNTPQIAHREVYSSAGAEKGALFATKDCPVSELAIGDVVVVKPGELIPVDGILLTPEATLDESSLTGESIPVERVKGDAVISGSVNGSAVFRMEVTALAADSQYQRIVELVKEASESKAPFVRLADRYAVPFTIVAYVLAITAWIISGNPTHFAEVLVVATPCPLIIAAPVAFIAGMSRAARHGIIVKNGGTLEKLARIKTVAFDKTGTLTHGQPVLSKVMTAPGIEEDELVRLAAIAEQYSAHTLAHSIVVGAQQRGLTVEPCTDVTETTAAGLTATIDGKKVVVGKYSFIAEQDPSTVRVEITAGELAVYVAIDGKFAGALLLRDELRADAPDTLQWLSALGVRHTLMLTGDGKVTAEHVARELGVTNVRAECLPLDKVRAVEAVTDRPVMMVGDGVNDAPVLAAADVGVAMGARGSTAASESADVVIMKDDLHRVARSIEIGQQTIRIALQSIWIGISLSLILMVLATFGLIPAVVGAGFQEVIDVIAILNALRALGTSRWLVKLHLAPRSLQPQQSSV
ncbi:heavy metal translocating P-type ATPase [Aurantimicrobium minutum]|uniref:heavy metal translocating P-type ATPase n=1 Tax=Aurantimicrobium minutum TaxID=708131 RepID=UPI0024756EC2|nr:heavy metal translocating P-type ATPase [Aurantimicrobium minutum]MDH6409946.1 heavy metal translocating P-type ATPase [Aurantimicrobium minutum]MDH6424141.1 heavy metal translocating P-type ATPase [Aurantimicrobium minutum]